MIAWLGGLFAMASCTSSRAVLVSVDGTTALAPEYTTAVYTYADENTVHIYLTDLDPAALEARLERAFDADATRRFESQDAAAAGDDDARPSPVRPSDEPSDEGFGPGELIASTLPPVGQLTHIYMFVRPYAGRTPIDPTAANATIRHAVLAGDESGVYVGGGFVLPSTRAASEEFRADLRGASLSLGEATPGFKDLLGSLTMNAEFRAIRDERTARLLERTLRETARR
ncbi:MAG: hypothetical protein AAF108_00650 [Planctomycetota bacterium]